MDNQQDNRQDIRQDNTQDIPLTIPFAINPTIQNPASKSVIYTFNQNDIIHEKNGNILYRFPYSKNTVWTNFKYSVWPSTGQQLIIGIVLVTSENSTYSLGYDMFTQQNKWQNIDWPIPSTKSQTIPGSYEGVYLKIKPIAGDENIRINIQILGFIDLFPRVENYILTSRDYLQQPVYEFVFTQHYKEKEGENNFDRIYNIEHIDYIRNILPTSYLIYPVRYY